MQGKENKSFIDLDLINALSVDSSIDGTASQLFHDIRIMRPWLALDHKQAYVTSNFALLQLNMRSSSLF